MNIILSIILYHWVLNKYSFRCDIYITLGVNCFIFLDQIMEYGN